MGTRYTEEELLEQIRYVGKVVGRRPNSLEFHNHPETASRTTIQNQFESWKSAIEKAGYSRMPDRTRYNDEELLTKLRQIANDSIAPNPQDIESQNGPCLHTYQTHFQSWWVACVRAGLRPRKGRPLTSKQYQEYYSAAVERSNPIESVYGLLVLITGIPPRYVSKLSYSWCEHLDKSAYQPMITVPEDVTSSGKPWTFRIPEHIHFRGKKVKTELPELLQWYFSGNYGQVHNKSTVQTIIKRIGADILPTDREMNTTRKLGRHPVIRSTDLRASTGVHLARRGAAKTRIQNHLGIPHTNWEADVRDFYLWNYVHENIKHDQFDPPEVYLDPESGEPQYS